MINVQVVIDRLSSQTPFIIDWAREIQPSLEYQGTPLVKVGYGTIKSSVPGQETAFGDFNINGEDLIQVIETHFICTPQEFYTQYKILYKALQGFNPITSEAYRTSLSVLESGVVGLDNGVQRWLDRWRIGFSTVNNDF